MTGLGDRHRPESPIVFTGIRKQVAVGVPGIGHGSAAVIRRDQPVGDIVGVGCRLAVAGVRTFFFRQSVAGGIVGVAEGDAVVVVVVGVRQPVEVIVGIGDRLGDHAGSRVVDGSQRVPAAHRFRQYFPAYGFDDVSVFRTRRIPDVV